MTHAAARKRHPAAKRRAAAPIPEHMLAPGYFTELIRLHNWPPMFASRIDVDRAAVLKGAAAIAQRERAAHTGEGWASGTLPMPKTPGHLRPTWMLRAPAALARDTAIEPARIKPRRVPA